MRRLLAYSGVLLLTLGIGTGAAAEASKKCAPSEIKQARREASHLEDWNAVNDSFKRFGRCDAGKLAEDYSYAIGNILARDWEHLNVLLPLASADDGFKRFVLRHIDENIPEGDIQLIMRNARERCPPGGEWLCKAIVDY